MTTPANQMLASVLANKLSEELAAFDAQDGSVSWLRAATRVLHPNDHKKLVAATRKRLERLLKEADGCPSRIFGWPEYFGTR